MTNSSDPGADAPAVDTDTVLDPDDVARLDDDVVEGELVDAEPGLEGLEAELGDLAGYGSCEEALEDAVASLERVTAERDDYLDTARRVQAEFANYRKRVESQRADQIARAAESLVVELLPVLDGCEAAVAHGAADVEPILSSLTATLNKQGLAKVDDVDIPFDPNLHEAVLSDPGPGGDDGPVVVEVLRAGYHWSGRVLRPAMVKVRG